MKAKCKNCKHFGKSGWYGDYCFATIEPAIYNEYTNVCEKNEKKIGRSYKFHNSEGDCKYYKSKLIVKVLSFLRF